MERLPFLPVKKKKKKENCIYVEPKKKKKEHKEKEQRKKKKKCQMLVQNISQTNILDIWTTIRCGHTTKRSMLSYSNNQRTNL